MNKLLTAILLFLILLCAQQSTSAQTITATVLSFETDEPLVAASVVWNSTKEGVLTDETGYFEIDAKYDSLTISYIGYHPKTIATTDIKQFIRLQETEYSIEEVRIRPKDPYEIMDKVIENYVQNHYLENSKQAGFGRAKFYERDKLFQYSETAYNAFYSKDKNEVSVSIHPIKTRTIFDSLTYKTINNTINRKKDTVDVPGHMLISLGQSFGIDLEDDKVNRKDQQLTYLGTTTYDGRNAYQINSVLTHKRRELMELNFLIDIETYAFLAIDYESVSSENLNKVIPFYVKAVLKLLGYTIQLNHVSGRTYYRLNEDIGKFELDKGTSSFSFNIKKKGNWLKGSIVQEFYLNSLTAPVNKPAKNSYNSIKDDIVQEFTDDYFNGHFHLTPGTHERRIIKALRTSNQDFEGSIISDRNERWQKRKEKRNKKEER